MSNKDLEVIKPIRFDREKFRKKEVVFNDDDFIIIDLINAGVVEFYNQHVKKNNEIRAKSSLSYNKFLDFCDVIGANNDIRNKYTNRKKSFKHQSIEFIKLFSEFMPKEGKELTIEAKQKHITRVVKDKLKSTYGIVKDKYYPSKVTLCHLATVISVRTEELNVNPDWSLIDFPKPTINKIYNQLFNKKDKKDGK